MANKKKKVQKNIQKKRAKQKSRQKSSGFQRNNPFEWTFKQTTEIECLVPVNIFKSGMGNVVFARKLENGFVAMAIFLVDIFCLGVKDALDAVVSAGEYSQKIEQLDKVENSESVSPACCRKLVEGAEAYARELGFSPHRDYKSAGNLFGDVDPNECEAQFEYGKDGKPLYVSGKYDSQVKQNQIIAKLEKKLGPDGFHYISAIPQDDFTDSKEFDNFSDFED